MRFQERRHGAFTLVELLVVIAIVGVLAALTVGATIRIIDSQRESNTQSFLQTLDKGLQTQVKAVLDQAEKEVIPANVYKIAGNDAAASRRARVIWKCLRLKQEFPINFVEVMYPSYPYMKYPPPAPPLPPDWPLVVGDLAPIPSYLKAIGATYNNGVVAPGVVDSPVSSAGCLLMSLQRARKGANFNQDAIAGSIGDINGDGVSELLDGWSQPLYFSRFPSGSTDLNGANPAAAGARGAILSFPVDPDGLLMDTNWNNWANYATNGNRPVYWFEQLCFPIHVGNGAGYQAITPLCAALGTGQKANYMIPVIVSSGPNGNYKQGTGLGLNMLPPQANPPWLAPPWPGDMSILVTPAAANDSNDNIYSYKLAVGAKGT